MRKSLLIVVAMLWLATPLCAVMSSYSGSMSGAKENPATASPGTGSAFVTYDSSTHMLYVSFTFSGLVGGTTAAHIHCCVAPSANAGVATTTPTFAGTPLGVSAGSYSNTLDLTLPTSWNAAFILAHGGTTSGAEAFFVAGLQAGQTYLNIHTTVFPGGEIRDFLTRVRAKSDLNGDGRSDIVIQNSGTNEVAGWLMNGSTITAGAVISAPAPDWKVVTSGDLDGDGVSDLILKNDATRAVAQWRMLGTTILSGNVIATPASDWRVACAQDFTNDDKADLILQNAAGTIAQWQMSGGTQLAGYVIASPGADWKVIAAASFNNEPGILMQNSATGSVVRWLLAGSTITSGVVVSTPQIDWKLKGAGDMTNDNSPELVLQNASTNAVAVWSLSFSGTLQTGRVIATPPAGWSVTGVADYDGDRRSDILLRNSIDNSLAIWQTDGTTILGGSIVAVPDAAWTPVTP